MIKVAKPSILKENKTRDMNYWRSSSQTISWINLKASFRVHYSHQKCFSIQLTIYLIWRKWSKIPSNLMMNISISTKPQIMPSISVAIWQISKLTDQKGIRLIKKFKNHTHDEKNMKVLDRQHSRRLQKIFANYFKLLVQLLEIYG